MNISANSSSIPAAVHVVTDIDGTISFAGKRPTAEIRNALHRLARHWQVSLSIATARSPRVIDEWFAPLRTRLGGVCCNGAIVASADGKTTRRELDPLLVSTLIPHLRSRGEQFCLEYGDHFAASHHNALPWMGTRSRTVIDGVSPRLEGVVKLSIATGSAWIADLNRLVGGSAEVYRHVTGDVDVVAPGTNKAIALRRLIRPQQVLVALGNDLNDREMLLAADYAILVGDQLPELDDYAHVRRVSARPDAVAETLVGVTHSLPTTPIVRSPISEPSGRVRAALQSALAFRVNRALSNSASVEL